MSTDLKGLHYSPIIHYDYPRRFEEIQYNGETLSPAERERYALFIDQRVEEGVFGLKLMHDGLAEIKDLHGEFYDIQRAVVSLMLFVDTTMTEILVFSKYFILADKDYDRRVMRGKLKVVLNEGFKKLYGFNEKKRDLTEWGQLAPLMKHFPPEIRRQHKIMTILLNNQASTSSWWKKERDLETHLDAAKMFVSRSEEIIESKVMMESLKLYNALLAVNEFLSNANACLLNTAIDKYRRGEIAE